MRGFDKANLIETNIWPNTTMDQNIFFSFFEPRDALGWR
jgi:hypothetical protein